MKLAGILGGVLGYLSWANLGWASLVTFLAGGLVSLALVLFTKARGSTRIAFGPFMRSGCAGGVGGSGVFSVVDSEVG